MPSTDFNPWRIDNDVARLQSQSLRGQFSVSRPLDGLTQLSIWQPPAWLTVPDASLLSIRLPDSDADSEQVLESWLRGTDLVVRYAAGKQGELRPELYWRLLEQDTACGVELIVSVQTGLLDDTGVTQTSTRLPVREVLWLADPRQPDQATRLASARSHTIEHSAGVGLIVLRVDETLSYVEMVYPSDFWRAEVRWSDHHAVLNSQLFPERLEKGVIRRGRMRGWFLPRSNDCATAARLFNAFARSSLPLTT